MISDNNRNYVTIIETVNVIDVVIKSMFILSKKIYLKRFYRDLKNKILIKLLETKYVINEFIFTYIQYFKR